MIKWQKIKNRWIRFEEKIKEMIHKNNLIDTVVFFVFGLFRIVKSKIIFRDLRKNKPEIVPSNKKKSKILVLAIRAIPSTNLVYFDAIFGHGFLRTGCDVMMLYCDGLMASCDADTVFRSQKAQCFSCTKLGPSIKNCLGLEQLQSVLYRDYISTADISEIKRKVAELKKDQLTTFQYMGVQVGSHAQVAAIRYFLSGRIDLDNPKEEAILREKLIYAMITVKVASEIIKKDNPDTVFMLHGIYSSWGPFLSYFHNHRKDTYVYDNKLAKLGYFTFHHNCEPYKIFGQDAWIKFSSSPLRAEEMSQLSVYINKRFEGRLGEYSMYKGDFHDLDAKNLVLKSLFEKDYSRRYILYPNVSWDGSIKGYTSETFKDMFDWLDKTVDFFKKNKNYQLIIKSHPAEIITDKCNVSLESYLKEKHGLLPDNIVVLSPDVAIKSYDLMDKAVLSITYDGTIGLELALLGLPVLVAGDSHYKEAGVVKKIETLSEYYNLIENPEELVLFAKSHIELAKKYAYFYFFKSMVRVPFYSEDKWSEIDWSKLKNIDELFSPENDFMKICEKIANKQDIVAPL